MSTNIRRFGKYELQERLGQGGMAEVWKAFDTQLRRYVAIKLLHPNLQAAPDFVSRFQREAQVIASLHHPNIVQIHDFYTAQPPESESNLAYMVMDYVEGQTLADYIRATSRTGKFPPAADIVHLFTSISLAVDYAHQHGMIHRDIKPANILLDKRNTTRNPMGEPILSDFGIAKLLGATTGSMSSTWLGTPLYVSPEQAMGHPGNERSDIYSLGAVLYEIFTGVPPFQGGSPTGIMMQHLHALPTPPALINPAIPPALTVVLLRSLAKDPAARFPSASSLTAALAEATGMPVPTDLSLPAYPADAMNMPTYLTSQSAASLAPSQVQVSNPPSYPYPAPVTPPFASISPVSGPMPAVPPPIQANSTPVLPPTASSSLGQSGIQRTLSPTPNPSTVVNMQQPSTPPPAPAQPGRRRVLLIAALVVLILAVIGASVAAFFIFLPNSTPPPPTSSVVGQVYLISSGRVDENSNRGINDGLVINLHNIPAPDAGKSYYGWLVSDLNITQLTAISLGQLAVNNGTISLLYHEPQHLNLLADKSQFVITEEDSSAPPLTPSFDRHAWTYYAAIPQQVNPADNLSMLSHLRHLLSADPTLEKLHLPGGLNIWLLRNTQKVLEWAGSARDDWTTKSPDLLHKHLVRILEYLDGLTYVRQDVPDTPFVNYVNATIAQVPLLAFPGIPNQQPPDYLHHIDKHMHAVIAAPGVRPDQSKLASDIDRAINNVGKWLTQVRTDAKQLVVMNSQQLLQDSSFDLLDDMVTQAAYAFIGQPDPATDMVNPGVSQIYYDIQKLATFEVTAYKA